MRRFLASLTSAIIFLTPSLGSALRIADTPESRRSQTLLYMVERSTLVVVGTVVRMDYVRRNKDQFPGIYGGLTTDMTVRVDDLIKGKPNAGKKYVKFMIPGGKGISPRNGRAIQRRIAGQVEFELGEKAVLFLRNKFPKSPNGHLVNYPHGGYRMLHPQYKREILDGYVQIAFMRDETSRPKYVDVPLELGVNLAKAFLKDKAATCSLEQELKFSDTISDTTGKRNKVFLPEALVKDLIEASKKILDKEKIQE